MDSGFARAGAKIQYNHVSMKQPVHCSTVLTLILLSQCKLMVYLIMSGFLQLLEIPEIYWNLLRTGKNFQCNSIFIIPHMAE